MKSEMKNVKLSELVAAPWNPRASEELATDNASMVELIASVRHAGVIEPIVVWRVDAIDSIAETNPETIGKLVVIAGNRRTVAARAAGLETIPAVVRTGLTEIQAREITRIENEVRLGIDPFLDAKQIGEMLELGYDQKEIAARFGQSEAMICRRAKLLSINPGVIEAFKAVEADVPVSVYERIATQYSPEIQLKAVKSFVKRNQTAIKTGASVKWSWISTEFSNITSDLDADKEIDKYECVNCPRRTGAIGDLFGDLSNGKLGRCLDGECFKRKQYTATLAKVRAIAKASDDTEIIDTDARGMKDLLGNPFRVYFIDNELKDYFGERKTKKRPTVYFQKFSWESNPRVVWGPSFQDLTTVMARLKEDIAQAKAARDAEDKAQMENREKWRKLKNTVDNLGDDLDAKFAPFTSGDLKVEIKKMKFLENVDEPGDDILAGVIAEFLVDEYGQNDLEERLGVAKAIGLTKFLKLDDATWAAWDGAREDLDDFELEHHLGEHAND